MPTFRVFWPVDVIELERQTDYQPSLVIGWKNTDHDQVVVTTLPFLDPNVVESLLVKNDLLVGSQYSVTDIYELCGLKKLSVLGILNANENISISNSRFGFSATLDDTMEYPEHKLRFGSVDIQVIAFGAPNSNRMQYISIAPISLELSEISSKTVINEEYEAALIAEQRQKRILIQNMYQHASQSQDLELGCKTLIHCIAQMNCCLELGELMRKNAAVSFPLLRERRRRLSVSQSAIKSAVSMQNHFFGYFYRLWTLVVPYFLHICISMIMVTRLISESILVVIEYKLSVCYVALKDISATAQQIDLRLQQFAYWPIQYIKIRKRSRKWATSSFNLEYIRYYNSIWLVANDIIFGVAVGGLILDNKDFLVSILEFIIDEILTNRFKCNMLWLMDWPGGLKLNNELADFFGELFLWVVHLWIVSISLVKPYFGLVISVIGWSGFLGLTLSISLISDCLSLLTVHVYSFYVASARIYHWQLVILRSLFHLFRGKKHNVLRNRIDSVHYDLDQLLMGTIFFTVLLFLLPTVLVFYLFFAFTRLTIVLTCALLEFTLMCLNHFPLFAILLRFKDHQRVPGGFELRPVRSNRRQGFWSSFTGHQDRTDRNANGQSLVILKPIPLGIQQMFHQYFIVSQRLSYHYMSVSTIQRILTGQFVPIQRSKLYGLLYSMLPEKRIGVQRLYEELQQLYDDV